MENPYSSNTVLPKKLWQTFPFLAGIFTILTLTAAIWSMGYQKRTGNIQTMSDGLHTCFSRVTQSFTSRMIGEKASEYLRSSFFTSTEDCFGDVISFNRQNVNAKRDKNIGLALNQLSSEVYLFHELIRPAVGFQNKNANLIPERYGKLETLSNNLENIIDSSRSRLNKYMARLRKFITAGAFIIGTLSLLLLGRMHIKSKRRQEIEAEARTQLGEGHYIDPSSIKKSIINALELTELEYIPRLVQNFFNRTKELSEHSELSFVRPTDLRRIEEIWEKSNKSDQLELQLLNTLQSTESLKKIAPDYNSISDILARAIDSYSAKLFSSGVLVNLDTDEVQTTASIEILEQMIFGLFAQALDNIKTENANTLNITLKKEEGHAHFSIMRCSSDWGPDNNETTYLKIIRELLLECGGELRIVDAKDSNDQLIGRTFTITFPIENISKGKRVTSIRQGKKRQLMNEIL